VIRAFFPVTSHIDVLGQAPQARTSFSEYFQMLAPNVDGIVAAGTSCLPNIGL
jgi:hypothetical protein